MSQQADMSALVDSWMKSQQKIWNDWMETLQKASGGGGMQGTWEQGLKRWQEAVDKTLDTQSESMKTWAAQVARTEGAPPEAQKWAEEGVKMVEQWTGAQRGLWEQWFNMMAGAGQAGGGQFGADQLKQYMANWEQVTQQMQALQKQWASSLTATAKAKK